MRVVGCQLDIHWHDKQANFATVRQMLAGARVEPGSLIVLPEMFATGFSFDVAKIAEPADGPTNRFLAELAVEQKSYVIGGVVGREPDGRGRNEAVAFGPNGNELARYVKLHPFSYSGEPHYFVGGTDVTLFACDPWQVSPMVCYDLRFPEIFRHATLRGANLLVVIANWPESRITHWVTLLTARAIENQAYVIGVNRTGSDPKLSYSGRSLIVDPQGQILAELDEQPGILTADLNLAALDAYRREFPALADLRREFLAKIS